jgi:glycosyltransferase involved in cell wall biosynthesis
MVHNRYRSPGGEERLVIELTTLLERHGHAVHVLERSSGGVSRRRAAQALLTGGADPDEIGDLVRRFRADIVHAHNLHPLLGWRALAAARAARARTVLHLHNFRLFCAIGIASRQGAPCFRCHGRDPRPGVRYRCRGSLGESLVYAAGLYAQQPRLLSYSDELIAVSHAQALRLNHLGLRSAHLHVLQNFAVGKRVAQNTRAPHGRYALVTGRLVEEKGFDTAVLAARSVGVPLVIAGDGPDMRRLRELASGADVRFTGFVGQAELSALREGAAVVLVPSRSDDSFPYAALDALADGVPVLASDRGGLPELVGQDSVLPSADAGAWIEALSGLWHRPSLREERGTAGIARVRERFSDGGYYERLMKVYGATSRITSAVGGG